MAQHPNSLANLVPGGKKGAKHKVSGSLHKIAEEHKGDAKIVYARIMKLINSENDDTAYKGLTLFLKTFIISAEKSTEVDVEEAIVQSAEEQRELLLQVQEQINKRLGVGTTPN